MKLFRSWYPPGKRWASRCRWAFSTVITLTGLAGQLLFAGTSPTSPPPRAHATGHLQLTFTQRSPLNSLERFCERLDIDLASGSLAASEKAKARQDYDLSAEVLEAFVPVTYKTGVPHGLLVWTGVGAASPGWYNVLSSRKLILVSAVPRASNSGFVRMRLPLDVVHNMSNLYSIEPERVYLIGYSAGAGIATQLTCGFPDVFRGSCFLLGGRFYFSHRAKNGRFEPTLDRLAPKWKGNLEDLRANLRLVFLRAGGDTQYPPDEDMAQCSGLVLDGFRRVQFLVTPAGGHKPPDATWFERALAGLDAPPRPVLDTSPTKSPQPGPGQIAAAQRILATAQLNLERKVPKAYGKEREQVFLAKWRKAARGLLERAVEEYPMTPAATQARQMLQDLDR